MNQLTREQKLAAFAQLEKLPNVKRGTVFADELANIAQLLIEHPMAGRPWRILGPADDIHRTQGDGRARGSQKQSHQAFVSRRAGSAHIARRAESQTAR